MSQKTGIIDADLIHRTKHRFPNLACMKISAYEKSVGHKAELILSYDQVSQYDQIYVSKVFTGTPIPKEILHMENVTIGGTGFFYDKAPKLPNHIEHIKPDYNLYTTWVQQQLANGGRKSDYKFYLDYSIGFMTRGCFRQCPFCVNQNFTKVEPHSPLDEFMDQSKQKICLLDDNFLGCSNYKQMLNDLQATHKPFQFRQGLDERLLTDEKCSLLFNSKYDGDFTFAFDNINDYPIIEHKLQLIRKHTDRICRFYVLCGFDRNNKWDDTFWVQDLWDTWERIDLLMKYHCIPYIMRFQKYTESPFRGIYVTLARWCNQPSMFKKKSIREYAETDLSYGQRSSMTYLLQVEKDLPELATRYFDQRWTKE